MSPAIPPSPPPPSPPPLPPPHPHRLTRSTRSNGYAASQVSFGSNQGRPLTPRTPTGLSVTSPSFEYTDAPKYDLQTSRYVVIHIR